MARLTASAAVLNVMCSSVAVTSQKVLYAMMLHRTHMRMHSI
jgi:hypothetical protein